MNIVLPREVKSIIASLEGAGFSAYAVGGCVRDALLGREPKDWDITTSAMPEEIKAVFPVTIDTGIEHGTVTVRLHGESYEVTTFRTDGEYLDGRHPSEVTFVRDLKEDLRRRDFTVNAMAYNEKTGLVDEFGGCDDLREGIICCVEDPVKRFSEDALRMMRAVRFVSQLGFTLEEKTAKAIKELAPTLQKISVERICDELIKLITSDRPETMKLMYELGLSRVVLPEWDRMMETEQNTKHHLGTVGYHTMLVLKEVPPTKALRLSALLHDVAKPVSKRTDANGRDHFVGHPQVGAEISREIMHRLKLDNDTIERVSKLVRYHDDRPASTMRNVRRMINRVGDRYMEDLILLKYADVRGQSDYKKEEKYNQVRELEKTYRKIKERGDCTDVSSLCISGKDIIELGFEPGPQIGEILKALLMKVILEPELNEKSILSDLVKKGEWHEEI